MIPLDHAACAAEILAQRRKRDEIFGSDMDGFGEPAWDILLALFIADASETPLSTSAALLAGCKPPHISERYLEWMQARLLATIAGERVSLTLRGRSLMTKVIEDYAGRQP